VSRLITDKKKLSSEHKHSAQHLKLYLMRAMTQESLSRPDAGPLYAILETPLLRSLQDIGVAMNVLGEPLFSEKYNSSNILVEFRLQDMTREMFKADNKRIELFPSLEERFGPFMEGHKSELGLGRMALKSDFHQTPNEQYERNYGWLNEKEHQKIADSVVAIAGVGGDGGALAVQLARMGVKNFRLADPDPFEVENINRQEGAKYETVGRNKAEVIAELIKEIQPFAKIDLYKDGVTPGNIANFVQGSNLVIDETEYTKHEIGVMIAREARRNKLPVLMGMNVGFGSYVTSFDPEGTSFEKYLGLSEDMALEDIAKQKVPLWKWVPHIPSYADMSIFSKIAAGEVSAPTVMPGVGVTAAHAALQAVAHLVRDISPSREAHLRFAPRGQSIDIIDGSHEVRYSLAHFAKSALVAIVRTRIGKNPPMNYSSSI
jgi:molybdopterin/thiamine biosynthesis adenylyltransferase